MITWHFERLDPTSPLFAQAQRHIGLHERAIRGVEIQRSHPGAGRSQLFHVSEHTGASSSRHMKLEFLLGHVGASFRHYIDQAG